MKIASPIAKPIQVSTSWDIQKGNGGDQAKKGYRIVVDKVCKDRKVFLSFLGLSASAMMTQLQKQG